MANLFNTIFVISILWGSIKQIEATCDETEFTCDDGTCISSYFECDGKKHCPDGSDETRKVCSEYQCPKNGFQCSYGACIDLDKKCDGKKHCADNSDENNASCRLSYRSQPVCRFGSFQCNNKECIDEFEVCDGTVNCSDGSDESREECINFPCPRKLGFQCDYGACVKKTSLCNGIKDCRDGSDERNCSPPPKISNSALPRECSLPVMPDNGIYKIRGCSNRNKCKTVNGNKAALGTQLQYKCNSGFELSVRNNITSCTNYEWYPPPTLIFCQACGTLQSAQPLVSKGTEARPEEHPWNVGLYRTKESDYELFCGGSIITSSLILTAAHCVVDPTQSYKIATGKTSRFWNINDKDDQRLDVEKIHIHPDYKDKAIYAFDVALLETKRDIVFGATAWPICFVQEISSLKNGSIGTVAGWGRDENNEPSKVLKSVDQEFIDNSECRRIYNTQSYFISHTSVCGLYKDGAGVRTGDSGAGFTFKIKNSYYLRGIVSTGLNNFSTYTDLNVESIYNFISATRIKVTVARNNAK